MTFLYALGGLLVGLVAVGFAFNALHKPTRFFVLLLAFVTATTACDLRTKSKAVKVAVSTEAALGTLQDSLRAICSPSTPFPTPIPRCTPESEALGLTTTKFRAASGKLAQAFEVMDKSVVPAIKLWKVCPSPAPECAGIQTPQSAFTTLYAFVDDAITILRTLGSNPKFTAVLDAVQLVTDTLGALGGRVVRMQ